MTTTITREENNKSINTIKLHNNIYRGDIYMCDLYGAEGQIQSGIRPCLVVSNSIGNRYSNIVVVVPISSSTSKKNIPTHIELLPQQTGLLKPSILLAEQIRTIDQWCLMQKVGSVTEQVMKDVDKVIAISIGLDYLYRN